ncbi:Opsin-2 [Eumeta japonica]|uniref:Opsin-2 n=1 Tax=Eumeta variegata TaxID=151549 RepID=A0A4C1U0W8_EUMVA|nr:Opsin-2 [Eumeta japonica]
MTFDINTSRDGFGGSQWRSGDSLPRAAHHYPSTWFRTPHMENDTEPPGYAPYYSPFRSGEGVPAVEMLGAGLTGEDLAAVPTHWLAFPAPPAAAHTALALLYTFFTAAALLGNGLVIYIFATTKSLRTSSNLLILQLAVMDFIMMAKAPIFIYNSVMRGFATGALGCQIFSLMGAYSGIGAGMTNACIAYDSLNISAVAPLHHLVSHQSWQTVVSGRPIGAQNMLWLVDETDGYLEEKVLLMIVLVWIYATPWALLPLFKIWGRFVPVKVARIPADSVPPSLPFQAGTFTPLTQLRNCVKGYLTSCTFDYLTNTFDTKLFVGCIFVCSYVFPMSLIIYFYSGIVKQVFAHEAALRYAMLY